MKLYWAFCLLFIVNISLFSKTKLKLEDFMKSEVFSLSFAELNERFSPTDKRFKPKVQVSSFEKSSTYPQANSCMIKCGDTKISYLTLRFDKMDPFKLISDINEKYGKYFYSHTYTITTSNARGKGRNYLWYFEKEKLAVIMSHDELKRNQARLYISDKFGSIPMGFSHKKYDDPKRRKIALSSDNGYEMTGLNKLIDKNNSSKVFEISTESFEDKYFKEFSAKWTGKLKRSARSVKPLQFSDIVSKESIFNFSNGKFKSLTAMIYNKGDQQFNLSKTKFSKVINDVKASVEKFTGVKAQFKPNAGLARNNLYWWNTNGYFIKLDASFTQTSKTFTSNYIRLSFSPEVKGINAVNVDKVSINSLSASQLKDMVVREPNGAVYISGVPMVDQGQKGYCACAAAARLLNYYGRDIDQHDLAKLAMTDKYGTTLEDLKKALSVISSKFRLHVQTVARCYLGSDRDYKRFVKKIEIEYKKNGWRFRDPLKVKDLKKVFASLSLKDQRYKDFKRGVKRSIDMGKPLVWALMLGIIPEPEIPQANGGHMRLIIGYNEKTDEIYYTDTWGAGHEKKSMDLKSAFWISSALWEVRPR